jgi:hypothetical protein
MEAPAAAFGMKAIGGIGGSSVRGAVDRWVGRLVSNSQGVRPERRVASAHLPVQLSFSSAAMQASMTSAGSYTQSVIALGQPKGV